MPLPTGIILLWSGAIVDIPAGFILCDGNGGSPDLRDRFVVGAGDSYAPGATGGSVTHTHSFTSDGHFHTLPGGTAFNAGTDFGNTTDTKTDTGTTNSGSTLPPYYALAFIMKT